MSGPILGPGEQDEWRSVQPPGAFWPGRKPSSENRCYSAGAEASVRCGPQWGRGQPCSARRWAVGREGEGPCQEADSPGQGASAVQVGVKAFRQLWIKQRVLRGQRWEGSRPAVGKLGVRSRNLRFETFRNIFRMRSCWLSTIIVFDQVFKNVLIFNRLHRFRIEVFWAIKVHVKLWFVFSVFKWCGSYRITVLKTESMWGGPDLRTPSLKGLVAPCSVPLVLPPPQHPAFISVWFPQYSYCYRDIFRKFVS